MKKIIVNILFITSIGQLGFLNLGFATYQTDISRECDESNYRDYIFNFNKNVTYARGKGCDLYGADLSGANLFWADLSGASLRWADLSKAILYGADLRWPDLSEADLAEADLRWANLRWADLRGADLRGADLRGADLRGANLENTRNLSFIICNYETNFPGFDSSFEQYHGINCAQE